MATAPASTPGMIWTASLPFAYLKGMRDAARLEITIQRHTGDHTTINHATVGHVDRFSMVMSSSRAAGQCIGYLNPRDPGVRRLTIGAHDALMLRRIWQRWHLNDMRQGCRHQRHTMRKWSKAAKKPYHSAGNNWSRGADHFFKLTCDATGYRFGSGWLVEPLPTDRLIRRLTSILARCDGAVIRDYR